MRHRYDRQGALAIDPKAFLWMFNDESDRVNEEKGGVAIVKISGPLDQHSGGWCDSYDSIKERVGLACAGSCSTILLKLDSPGGDCCGCFETSREIRKMAAAAGKRLVAYVDGQACSGAYALACAAEQVTVPATGFVGSVGVINTRLDATGANEMFGLRFSLTTSGKRKADGHPDTAVTAEEQASTQSIVDSLAGVFFQLVSEMRDISVESVAGLEAQVFHGDAAVSVGLADNVASFEELLASLQSGEPVKGKANMATKMEEARAALEEAAKGEGDEAEKAKRALAAMDDEPAEEEAEGDEPPAEDDEEEPAEEASAAAAATARGTRGAKAGTSGELAMLVQAQGAQLSSIQQELEAERRDRFLATRGDLNSDLVKLLKSKPLNEVKAIVNAIPKPKAAALAAATTVQATRGDGQSGDASKAAGKLAPEHRQQMKSIMGTAAPTKRVVKMDGSRQVFGVSVPKEGN